jgi:uncharacterized protein (UPF0264 family)
MIRDAVHQFPSKPLLLVSVRNAQEAAGALAGGADVIDVKEPSRGPLGPADSLQIESVLRRVGSRRPVSIAAGELLDAKQRDQPVPHGIQYVKFGLSRCRGTCWQSLLELEQTSLPPGAQIVPVVYADWCAVGAPSPDDVLRYAIDHCCPIVLVDTFAKEAGSLFRMWSFSSVASFVDSAHAVGTIVALAGRLKGDALRHAVMTGADIVGVRGAACIHGREGPLSRALIEQVRHILNRDPRGGVGQRTTRAVRALLDKAT